MQLNGNSNVKMYCNTESLILILCNFVDPGGKSVAFHSILFLVYIILVSVAERLLKMLTV